MTIILDRDGSLAGREAPPGLDEVAPVRSVMDPTRGVSTPVHRDPGNRLLTTAMSSEPRRAVEQPTKLVTLDTQKPLCSGEAEAVGYIVVELTEASLAVEMLAADTQRPNVVARLDNGHGPIIALNTHMAVMPAGDGWSGDPFRLRDGADGRLYDRSACDAKGSLDVARNLNEFLPLIELVTASRSYRDIAVAAAAVRR